jgi:hypothetical protein
MKLQEKQNKRSKRREKIKKMSYSETKKGVTQNSLPAC